MDHHRQTGPGQRPDGGQKMQDMAVHAPVRNHAHQMRGPARGLQFPDECQQGGIAKEGAGFDGKIDRPQVHRHHAARADVGVAHLGIAHLPGRQTDIGTKGGQRLMRAVRPEAVEVRNIRKRRGIRRPVFTQAPAIENTQHDGFRNGHHGAFRCAALFYAAGSGGATMRSPPGQTR